jgi:hypothetical protein
VGLLDSPFAESLKAGARLAEEDHRRERAERIAEYIMDLKPGESVSAEVRQDGSLWVTFTSPATTSGF